MPMAQQNRFVFFLLVVVLVVAVVFVVLVVFVVVAVVSSSRQRWLRLDLLPTAFLLLRSLLMAAATFLVSPRRFDFGVFEGQLELPVLTPVFGFPFLFLLEKVLMRFDGGPWIFLEIR